MSDLIGSVSENGGAPDVHGARLGREAYEAWHTHYYLEDLFAHRNDRTLVGAPLRLIDLAMRAIGGDAVEFLELGSTLFAAVEKLDNAASLDPSPRPDIRWLGVEMSDWLCRVADAMHPGRGLIHYPSWRDAPPAAVPRFTFVYSVGSYAFAGGHEYGSWIATTSRFAVLRERFSLGRDIPGTLMGKRYKALSLTDLAAVARQHGKRLKVLAWTEGRDCFDAVPDDCPPIVDALVAVHDLTAAEMVRFESGFSDLDQHPAYNCYPPLHLTAEILREGPDPFSSARWERRYRKPTAVGGKSRFDFPTLAEPMEAHVRKLAALYDPTA
jgi:hypothetical protein